MFGVLNVSDVAPGMIAAGYSSSDINELATYGVTGPQLQALRNYPPGSLAYKAAFYSILSDVIRSAYRNFVAAGKIGQAQALVSAMSAANESAVQAMQALSAAQSTDVAQKTYAVLVSTEAPALTPAQQAAANVPVTAGQNIVAASPAPAAIIAPNVVAATPTFSPAGIITGAESWLQGQTFGLPNWLLIGVGAAFLMFGSKRR